MIVLSGELVLAVGSPMGRLVVDRVVLLILRVHNEHAIDILHSREVSAVVEDETVKVRYVKQLVLKGETQPDCQLVVKVLEGDALVVHDDVIEVLEDVGDELLVVVVDLPPHFIDSLGAIVSQLICDMGLSALQEQFVRKRIENVLQLRKAQLHKSILKYDGFFQVEGNLGEGDGRFGLYLQEHVNEGQLKSHDLKVSLHLSPLSILIGSSSQLAAE